MKSWIANRWYLKWILFMALAVAVAWITPRPLTKKELYEYEGYKEAYAEYHREIGREKARRELAEVSK